MAMAARFHIEAVHATMSACSVSGESHVFESAAYTFVTINSSSSTILPEATGCKRPNCESIFHGVCPRSLMHLRYGQREGNRANDQIRHSYFQR